MCLNCGGLRFVGWFAFMGDMSTGGFFARFKTDDLPERMRVSAVREVLLEKAVPFDVGALPNSSFHIDMQVRDLPGLEMTAGHIVSHTIRNRPIMRDGKDDLLFSISIEGRLEADHCGRKILVTPGTAHLGSCADPIEYYTDLKRGLCLRVPRSAIAPFVPDLDDQLGKQIVCRGETLNLIDTYVRSLERDAFNGTPGMMRLAVAHVHDLVALAIGCDSEAAVGLMSRGLRSARLVAIKKDVVALLGRGDVTAEQLATRHGISPRYVRKLFEMEGTTLSAFMLEEKLQRGLRLLTSPLHRHRSISSIAYDVGFNDLSYFNRTFRRKFGQTPSDIRQAG